MTFKGKVSVGIVILEDGAQLQDGTEVTVSSCEVDAKSFREDDDRLYRLAELSAPTGISDLSVNIDHYLYGHPKQSDGRK